MDHLNFTSQFDCKSTTSFSDYKRINPLIFLAKSTIYQIQIEGDARTQCELYLGDFIRKLVEFGMMGFVNILNTCPYAYRSRFMVLASQPDPHFAASIYIMSQ
jgi:hypothetical protein